jgi:hypothetical protein
MKKHWFGSGGMISQLKSWWYFMMLHWICGKTCKMFHQRLFLWTVAWFFTVLHEPVFKDVIFTIILRSLCLPLPKAGTSDKQIHSRARKVKNVIKLNQHFWNFSPTLYLSADESTVDFKGSVVFKMYNPQKSIKWRFHIHIIADSTNGYDYVLILYYGSAATKNLMYTELTFTSRTHKNGFKM